MKHPLHPFVLAEKAAHLSRKLPLRFLPAVAIILSLARSLATPYAFAMDQNVIPVASAPNPEAWPDDSLTIAYLGHASLLMNYFGVRVLSDPSFFKRVGLSFDSVFTIGPQRRTPAPLAPSRLGHVDVLLVTHAHMDHLDIPSLKALPKDIVVIACEKCSRLIAPLGFTDIRELRWGEATEIQGLKVRAMGAAHWGKRWPPYGATYGFNSYVLEKNGHRMLLACDSANTELFAGLAADPPEVAAFSIGAYDPWIWNHANPEQVWKMFQETGAKYLVPIHWGTFKLSNEPMMEPIARLVAAAGDQSDRIVVREIGATWTLPAAVPMRAVAR